MTIFAELAKKYISIKVRLELMAQAAAGTGKYENADVDLRRHAFLQFNSELSAMLDVLEDVDVMTFEGVCDAKRALSAYFDRNYDRISAQKPEKIAEVRGHE